MTVYVVDGGDYENYGWYGVFSSAENAMAAFPIPDHVDAYFVSRHGGWMPDPYNPKDWWNGLQGDFGYHVRICELDKEL